MVTRPVWVAVSIAIAAFPFAGCGQDRSTASAPAPLASGGTGGLSLHIEFPEARPALVPVACQSVKTCVTNKDTGEDLATAILTPDDPHTTFGSLATGMICKVTATARPSADGTGTVQAEGSVDVTIPDGVYALVDLTMASTIEAVEITPASLSVHMYRTEPLTATARDAAGAVVLVSDTWQWSSSDPPVATVDGSGTVTGVFEGVVTVTAAETESAKSAGAAVTVIAGLADTPWPMVGHDVRRTGRSPYVGPDSPTEKWSVWTGGPIYSSPAIGEDGTIYVGSDDQKLYAVNPDGSLKWRYIAGDKIRSGIAVATGNIVYFGTDYSDNKLYAVVDQGAGAALRWTTELGAYVESDPLVDIDGTICVGCRTAGTYAVNPDGTRRWTYGGSCGGDCGTPIAAIGGDITYSTKYGELVALTRAGEKQWGLTLLEYPYLRSGPSVGDDGTIYVGADWTSFAGGMVYAVSSEGLAQWALPVGNVNFRSGFAIGSDGTLYFGVLDLSEDPSPSYIYAIDKDGVEKWVYPLGTYVSVVHPPAVDAAGTVYVGVDGEYLHAINGDDGTRKWRFVGSGGGDAMTAPAIGADGTIYVGCSDGRLYAIGS